jgi:aminomethyltransferase
MGEFWIKGKEALDLLQYVTTNDVSKVKKGKAQYNCMPNGKGGIVDDLIVYHYDDDKYFMVVNASNIDKDWNWINSHNKFDAELENASNKMSLLALQGPRSKDILKKVTSTDLDKLGSFALVHGEVAGQNNIIISTTGYTGSGGYELYMYNSSVEKVWKEIMNAGEEFGIKPAGLGARDTLRLEMGLCLYGNDLNESTSPLESGLGWITKFRDYKDFIDKEYLLKQKQEGIKRKLVGFELKEKGIPRKGYVITNMGGQHIGEVTSGTFSPSLEKPIGMGYVNIEHSKEGEKINIEIRNKQILAEVVNMPFLKR